jgi:transketolase
MGVGTALAEHHLAARFNRPSYPIVDHYTYAIVSDGDLMEGVSSEAAPLAATLGLGKLIYLYDNHISLEGPTEVAFIFIFTHDSIGLGEDGPTHQPIEHLANLRAIPGLVVLRPADANESAAAWRVAIQHQGPVALILSRQKLPVLDLEQYHIDSGLQHGAYVLEDAEGGRPDIVFVASGSEVHLILDAQDQLSTRGIDARVVSMPSWELFDAQPEAYRLASLTSRYSHGQAHRRFKPNHFASGCFVFSLSVFPLNPPFE